MDILSATNQRGVAEGIVNITHLEDTFQSLIEPLVLPTGGKEYLWPPQSLSHGLLCIDDNRNEQDGSEPADCGLDLPEGMFLARHAKVMVRGGEALAGGQVDSKDLSV